MPRRAHPLEVFAEFLPQRLARCGERAGCDRFEHLQLGLPHHAPEIRRRRHPGGQRSRGSRRDPPPGGGPSRGWRGELRGQDVHHRIEDVGRRRGPGELARGRGSACASAPGRQVLPASCRRRRGSSPRACAASRTDRGARRKGRRRSAGRRSSRAFPSSASAAVTTSACRAAALRVGAGFFALRPRPPPARGRLPAVAPGRLHTPPGGAHVQVRQLFEPRHRDRAVGCGARLLVPLDGLLLIAALAPGRGRTLRRPRRCAPTRSPNAVSR